MRRATRPTGEETWATAAKALRSARLTQLQHLTPEDIRTVLEAIRQASVIPRLAYHVSKHGGQLGANSEVGYLEAFRQHLWRTDLRIFTYLRYKDRVPFWELVAPDTGDTVAYNEKRKQVWTFFRPDDSEARAQGLGLSWIEVLGTRDRWTLEENWQWRE